MVFANIPPTLSLVMTSDMVNYLIVRATGAETLEMDIGTLVHARHRRHSDGNTTHYSRLWAHASGTSF